MDPGTPTGLPGLLVLGYQGTESRWDGDLVTYSPTWILLTLRLRFEDNQNELSSMYRSCNRRKPTN